MNKSSSAPAWAVLTLVAGFVVAFPFFRKSSSTESNAGQPTAANPTADQQFRTQRAVSGQLPHVAHAESEFASDQELMALVRAQLNSQPQMTSLPEWAPSESELESLIQSGAQSLASNRAKQRLDELPTLVSEQEAPTQDAYSVTASPASLAQLSSSPWENRDLPPHFMRQPEDLAQPTWHDEALAAKARALASQREIQPAVVDFMSRPTGVDVVSYDTQARDNLQRGSSQLPVQPAEAKRRKFVYQPGMHLPED